MYGENKPMKEKIKEVILKKEESSNNAIKIPSATPGGGKADARIIIQKLKMSNIYIKIGDVL